MTYQYALCLSRNPRQDNSDFPTTDLLPKMITDVPVPKVDEVANGEAIIEVCSALLTLPNIQSTNSTTDLHRRI